MKLHVRTTVLLLALCCAISTSAQLTQRNYFKPFTEEFIKQVLPVPGKWQPFPTTAEGWQAILPDSIMKQYIAIGNSSALLDVPAVTATGFLRYYRSADSPQADKRYSERRKQLFNLIMAESMENKGRFNDKIADIVWALCEESTWAIPAHLTGLPNVDQPMVDLFAAETASLLAWTYYFVGDNLDKVSKQLKPRIVSEINRRLFNPVLTAKWRWTGEDDPNRVLNNWSPWIMSNYITVNLLLETDEVKRAAAIKKGMNIIDRYVNGLGNDGAINEGPTYWFPSIGCLFDAMAVLHNASSGKIDIYKEPFLKKSAAFIYNMHIGDDYFVNVSDASVKIDADGLTLYGVGKAIEDPTLMAMGSTIANQRLSTSNKSIDRMYTRRFFNLTRMKECLQHKGDYSATRNAWMPEIQMMCSHANDGFFVASHGGHNAESHNHNDVGDLIVYYNGKPLFLDAGKGTYTARTFSKDRYRLWSNTSGYHNVPEINNIQQKDGRKYAAKNVQYSSNSKYTLLSMDLADAYPPEAGIATLKRTVTLYKKGGVELRDLYSLNKASSVTEHFMTVCKADLSRPGVILFTMPDQTKVRMLYNATDWNAAIETLEMNQPEDVGLKQEWEGKAIQRISLKSKKPLTKINASFRIQAL